MHDVGTRRPRRRSTLVAGAALVAVLVTGCGGTGTDVPASEPSTPPTSTGDIAAAVRLADLQNVNRPNTVYSVAARPAFTTVDGRPMVTELHSSNAASWPAGDYRLVVRCIGTGTLTAQLQIGEYLTWLRLPSCSATSSAGVVGLMLPRRGTGMSVTITPSPDTRAAVAYQVRRLVD